MVLLASNYDQSRFLKAADMQAEKKFRIKNVTEEEVGFGKDKERKLCVWFTSDARALVLNKTNIRTLAGAFGDPCKDWIGKIVIVFPTMAEYRGEMKPALRVRIPTPKGNGQPAAKPVPADDDLDIPASLKRAPKAAQPTTPPDELADLIDDDLNDEINI